MKYFLFISFAALLLNACTEDFFSQTVAIDPPPYDKQLSFHLNLTTQDSVVRIVMARNYGILENVERYEDWFVTGATAELYENGQKWLTLAPKSVDSGFVLVGNLPHPFQAGSTYELRAMHPDYPSVYAIQVVPDDFQVDSVRVRKDAVPGEFGDRIDLLEVFLKDQPGVKNYYEVRISKLSYELQYDPNTGEYDTTGIASYPLGVEGYNDPNVLDGYRSGGLISDQFFDGQTYKFQARFDNPMYGSFDSSLVIQVRQVTPDFFKWSRSFQTNYDNGENPLVEPISIFHNLDNGLGIFSITQEKTFILQ